MKKFNRQLVGLLLVVAVILFASVYQWFGPGLITTDHPATPTDLAAQGITLTERTVYHFAVFPLAILGVVGFVLAMIPKKDETHVA